MTESVTQYAAAAVASRNASPLRRAELHVLATFIVFGLAFFHTYGFDGGLHYGHFVPGANFTCRLSLDEQYF